MTKTNLQTDTRKKLPTSFISIYVCSQNVSNSCLRLKTCASLKLQIFCRESRHFCHFPKQILHMLSYIWIWSSMKQVVLHFSIECFHQNGSRRTQVAWSSSTSTDGAKKVPSERQHMQCYALSFALIQLWNQTLKQNKNNIHRQHFMWLMTFKWLMRGWFLNTKQCHVLTNDKLDTSGTVVRSNYPR